MGGSDALVKPRVILANGKIEGADAQRLSDRGGDRAKRVFSQAGAECSESKHRNRTGELHTRKTRTRVAVCRRCTVRKQQVPSMTHLFIHHARCVLATGALRLTEYVDNALHHPEEDVVRRGRDEQTHHPCTEPRLQGPSCREGEMMRLLAPTCRPKVLPRVAGAWPSASPSPPCPASASAQLPCPASQKCEGVRRRRYTA